MKLIAARRHIFSASSAVSDDNAAIRALVSDVGEAACTGLDTNCGDPCATVFAAARDRVGVLVPGRNDCYTLDQYMSSSCNSSPEQ